MVNAGIDLHKTQFTVCVRRSGGDKFWKYPPTDAGYAEFLKRAAAWQKAGHEVRVGVESTGNTRYFKARMKAAGIGVTVINTLKFKIVNESVKKTDKHDAATIAEFLEKDMLPESHLCSRESEQMRRLLKVRTTLVRAEVVVKNQIHALLVAEGLEDRKAILQSRKGRQEALDALNQWKNGLEAQPLVETLDALEGNVKGMEDSVRKLAEDDREELRTAIIQVVMGMRRLKKTTMSWRLMERYEGMKKSKGSGKSITATARKVAVIIWHMLSEGKEFDAGLMVDRKLRKKAESMSKTAGLASEALSEGTATQKKQGRIFQKQTDTGESKFSGVTGRKRKKVG